MKNVFIILFCILFSLNLNYDSKAAEVREVVQLQQKNSTESDADFDIDSKIKKEAQYDIGF